VTSKPDFKVMVLLIVFMQLTRDLFAIAKFLYIQSLPAWTSSVSRSIANVCITVGLALCSPMCVYIG